MRYDSHAIAEDSHNSSSTSESIVIDSCRDVVGTQIQLIPCWTLVANETLSLDESCAVFCPWTRALDVIPWTVEPFSLSIMANVPINRGGYMAEPSYEELKARLAELEKQAPGRRTGQLDFRVGEKGGVSVYGLGRFPVTLYYEQWIRLLDTAKELREFLEENKAEGKLKLKEKAAGA